MVVPIHALQWYRFADTVTNSHMQNFSNGRFVRNLYENMVMNHARRVMGIVDPTLNQLRLFENEDIPTRNTL